MVPFDVPFTDAIVVGGGTLLDHLRMQRVVPRRRTFRHFLMIDHLAFLTRASIFDSCLECLPRKWHLEPHISYG